MSQSRSIRERNDEFLGRVPLEEFIEELVRAIRHEVRNGLHILQSQERNTMATVQQTQDAITRYQAAVEARETTEETKISDLEHAVVPDSLVQSINDAAAKIEDQNKIEAQNAASAPPAPAPAPVTPAPAPVDGTVAADPATAPAS